MEEIPEEEIQRAEGVNLAHSHDGVTAEDGSLLDHLEAVHTMPLEPGLSRATQDGIHDRLHHESKATEDP